MSRFEPCTEFWSVLKVKWEQFNGGVGSSPWGAFLTTTTFLGHSLRILPIRAYQRLQGLHQQGCVKCQYESIIMRKGWQSRDGNVKLPRRSISSLFFLICWFWENCQFHFDGSIRIIEFKVFATFSDVILQQWIAGNGAIGSNFNQAWIWRDGGAGEEHKD